jgi:hypothetical protein
MDRDTHLLMRIDALRLILKNAAAPMARSTYVRGRGG